AIIYIYIRVRLKLFGGTFDIPGVVITVIVGCEIFRKANNRDDLGNFATIVFYIANSYRMDSCRNLSKHRTFLKGENRTFCIKQTKKIVSFSTNVDGNGVVFRSVEYFNI